jgi:hypothetical protein
MGEVLLAISIAGDRLVSESLTDCSSTKAGCPTLVTYLLL